MSKLKERIRFMVLGGVVILAVLVLWAWLRVRHPAAIAYTTAQLACYKIATTNFVAMVGRWPISASELVSNSMGIRFIEPPARDGWGREIIYEPYTTNTGSGRVVSYGRNGKPGGGGPDADIELRFP